MQKAMLARFFRWLMGRENGLALCWMLLVLALIYEYLARPWLMARVPGLELVSIAGELCALISLLGV